ncbi:YlzJ-like family protein [Paenibacillus sp. FSL E2-0177]|uniref:YlzJ-like family protein n=1 Tax=Paenibacillus sp. FSL E2-0177 TaxID=2921360 RepID=UPI0030EEAC57
MTLYTVVAMEQVWEGAFNNYAATREISVQGMLMQVEPMEEGRARIVRLLDCPLNRYLDPAFSPGSIITLT